MHSMSVEHGTSASQPWQVQLRGDRAVPLQPLQGWCTTCTLLAKPDCCLGRTQWEWGGTGSELWVPRFPLGLAHRHVHTQTRRASWAHANPQPRCECKAGGHIPEVLKQSKCLLKSMPFIPGMVKWPVHAEEEAISVSIVLELVEAFCLGWGRNSQHLKTSHGAHVKKHSIFSTQSCRKGIRGYAKLHYRTEESQGNH